MSNPGKHSVADDDAISPCSDDVHSSLKKTPSSIENDKDGIYEEIDFPAAAKPRYKLEKLQRFLFSTSNDVRRSENGGYRKRKDASGTIFLEIHNENLPMDKLTPSSQSTWRTKWNAAIKVVRRFRNAVRSRHPFRELREDDDSRGLPM